MCLKITRFSYNVFINQKPSGTHQDLPLSFKVEKYKAVCLQGRLVGQLPFSGIVLQDYNICNKSGGIIINFLKKIVIDN